MAGNRQLLHDLMVKEDLLLFMENGGIFLMGIESGLPSTIILKLCMHLFCKISLILNNLVKFQYLLMR